MTLGTAIFTVVLLGFPLALFAQSDAPEKPLSGGKQISEHSSPALALAFSPKGDVIATGGVDGQVRLWSVFNGKQRGMTIGKDMGVIQGLAFSPDAQLLAINGLYRDVIWNVARGNEVSQLKAPFGETEIRTKFAFSPDGEMLATGGVSGRISVWSVDTGQPIWNPGAYPDATAGISFSKTGDRITAAFGNGYYQFFEAPKWFPVRKARPPRSSNWPAALSPGGKFLATTNKDRSILLRSILDGNEAVLEPPLSPSEQTTLAIAPDGRSLANGHSDGTLTLWSTNDGAWRAKRLTWHKSNVVRTAFSADGKILASSDWDGNVRLWWTKTGAPRGLPIRLGNIGRATAIAISRQGDRVAIGGDDGRVRFWNVNASRPEETVIKSPALDISALSFRTDGNVLAVGYGFGAVNLFDPKSGKQARPQFKASDWSILTMAYSPDGETLAVAGVIPEIYIWNLSSEQPIKRTLIGPSHTSRAMAFSSDGNLFATASDTGIIHVWKLANKSENPSIKIRSGKFASRGHPTGLILSIAFSPDGKKIASADRHGNIFLWNTETGERVEVTFDHPRSTITFVRFNSDGKTLTTVSTDSTIRSWSVENGEQIGSALSTKDANLSWSLISPNGKFLVSRSAEGPAWIWPLPANDTRLRQ